MAFCYSTILLFHGRGESKIYKMLLISKLIANFGTPGGGLKDGF